MQLVGLPTPHSSWHAGGTRTCIHTPGAPLHEGEVTDDFIDRLLGTATLVSFDGRLTEAAILVAAAARQRGVRVLVEAERVRPHLERLLPLADYVVTSAHFPEVRHTRGGIKEMQMQVIVCDHLTHAWCCC